MDKLNINTIPPVSGYYWFIPRWAVKQGNVINKHYWSADFFSAYTERNGLFVGPLEPPIGIELPAQETEVSNA